MSTPGPDAGAPQEHVIRSFGARLRDVFDTIGQLCVGIDPHAYLLQEWGLPDSAAGVEQFGLRVVDAVQGACGIVKPQVAFFERHGSAGYAALERVIAVARDAGLLVIADAKRGDVGTSVDAYGEAWLSPGSPLESDAVTLSPYQGVGSIAGVLELALRAGKGAFVLAATSNPEARSVQTARVQSQRIADGSLVSTIVDEVHQFTRRAPAPASVGVVVGATVDLRDYGLTPADLVGLPVLAPGFGAQGAVIADLPRRFGPASADTVVTVSRSVLAAGPTGIADAVRTASAEVRACRR